MVVEFAGTYFWSAFVHRFLGERDRSALFNSLLPLYWRLGVGGIRVLTNQKSFGPLSPTKLTCKAMTFEWLPHFLKAWFNCCILAWVCYCVCSLCFFLIIFCNYLLSLCWVLKGTSDTWWTELMLFMNPTICKGIGQRLSDKVQEIINRRSRIQNILFLKEVKKIQRIIQSTSNSQKYKISYYTIF